MNACASPVICSAVEASADYYAILGVDPAVEGPAIRLAYRNLMRRYHPDVNRTEEAAMKATAINEAYACLGDPDERAAYDHLRQARHSRPTFTATAHGPAAPQRSAWQPQHAYMAEIHAEPPPTRWKVVSLGLAAIVTVITFKITSEVTGVVMPAPEPMVFVKTGPAVSTETSLGLRCKRAGAPVDGDCPPQKAPPAR